MADTTINGLAIENTSPTANDLLVLWNVAAGRTEKIKRSNLLSGYGALAVANTWTAVQLMQAGVQVGVAANALTRPQAGVVRQQLETVSLANNATLTIAAVSARGFFFAFNASNGNVAVGVSNGTAVTLLHNSGNFSATQDNANTLNIYPSGANLILQNKMADARNVSFWLIL